MSKFKVANEVSNAGTDQVDHSEEPHTENDRAEQCSDDFSTKAATIGVVVVGAALIEAAVIPAILIGAAAALAPKYFPKLFERMQPMFHSAVRGAYKIGRKAKSAVGEVKEQMSDIAAEVDAEEVAKAGENSANAAGAGAKS